MTLKLIGIVQSHTGLTKPILIPSGEKPVSRIQQAVDTFIQAESSPSPIICSVTKRFKNKSGETVFADMREDIWGTRFSDLIKHFYK